MPLRKENMRLLAMLHKIWQTNFYTWKNKFYLTMAVHVDFSDSSPVEGQFSDVEDEK